MYDSLQEIIPLLSERGITIEDPWDVVAAFESMVADYAGSKYAVAVDSCTNALFLCLKYVEAEGEVTVPANTYVSVPQAIIHSGCSPKFKNYSWTGTYFLEPYKIVDSATRFTKNMYIQGTLQCLSFHIKKILPIGKGGMILTDDYEAVKWLKKARYEGRDITIPYDQDNISMVGWNMYMPPEQAAYGIRLFLQTNDFNEDCGGSLKYPDVRKHSCFNTERS